MVGETGEYYQVRDTDTNSDGVFLFDRLDLKDYPLTVVRGGDVANGIARLSPTIRTAVVDLQLVRPTGRVSGEVIDDTGLQVAAKVGLKALVPDVVGLLKYTDAGEVTNDPDRGFRFENLFPGPYAVTASSFFSPEDATESGTLPEANPVADGLILVLQKNTSRLSGCVLDPEGAQIEPILDPQGIPLPLSVFITSASLAFRSSGPDGIRVDASTGCYESSIPLPPGSYTVQVTDTRRIRRQRGSPGRPLKRSRRVRTRSSMCGCSVSVRWRSRSRTAPGKRFPASRSRSTGQPIPTTPGRC